MSNRTQNRRHPRQAQNAWPDQMKIEDFTIEDVNLHVAVEGYDPQAIERRTRGWLAAIAMVRRDQSNWFEFEESFTSTEQLGRLDPQTVAAVSAAIGNAGSTRPRLMFNLFKLASAATMTWSAKVGNSDLGRRVICVAIAAATAFFEFHEGEPDDEGQRVMLCSYMQGNRLLWERDFWRGEGPPPDIAECLKAFDDLDGCAEVEEPSTAS